MWILDLKVLDLGSWKSILGYDWGLGIRDFGFAEFGFWNVDLGLESCGFWKF